MSHLATDRNVSASTQRQALNAVIFLYKRVLDMPIAEDIEPVRAKKYIRPPVFMSKHEVQRVFVHMQGIHLLMARMLYGCGLRLMECICLRIKDLDFDRNLVYVCAAKGGKDRTTLFPKSIHKELHQHVEKVRKIHEQDLEQGFGEVYLPIALSRKYPNASREFRWQYVFPAKNLSVDPRSKIKRRHHILESGLQKAIKKAVDRARIMKRVSSHTFRHSFATHMFENGVNIRVVQELMGHADVKTTEIYTHVMAKDISVVSSPLDIL